MKPYYFIVVKLYKFNPKTKLSTECGGWRSLKEHYWTVKSATKAVARLVSKL